MTPPDESHAELQDSNVGEENLQKNSVKTTENIKALSKELHSWAAGLQW